MLHECNTAFLFTFYIHLLLLLRILKFSRTFMVSSKTKREVTECSCCRPERATPGRTPWKYQRLQCVLWNVWWEVVDYWSMPRFLLGQSFCRYTSSLHSMFRYNPLTFCLLDVAISQELDTLCSHTCYPFLVHMPFQKHFHLITLQTLIYERNFYVSKRKWLNKWLNLSQLCSIIKSGHLQILKTKKFCLKHPFDELFLKMTSKIQAIFIFHKIEKCWK